MKDNPLFYTATMARMCAVQGYLEKSAEIYRYLLKTDPDNHQVREALADLETQLSRSDAAPVEAAPVSDRLNLLVGQWVGLLVERDLEKKFDDVREKIKTMNRQPE